MDAIQIFIVFHLYKSHASAFHRAMTFINTTLVHYAGTSMTRHYITSTQH